MAERLADHEEHLRRQPCNAMNSDLEAAPNLTKWILQSNEDRADEKEASHLISMSSFQELRVRTEKREITGQ